MKLHRKQLATTLASGLLAGLLFLSAGVLAQEPKPAQSAIVVQESATLVTFAGGTAKSGGMIKVRIDGPDGAPVFEASSKAGLVDWVLEANLADGRYHYDVWFTPAAAMQARNARQLLNGVAYGKPLAPELQPRYHSGVFVIEGGVLAPPPEVAPEFDHALSAEATDPGLFERLAGRLLNALVPAAAAADLQAFDSSPDINLDDSDVLFPEGEWLIGMRATTTANQDYFFIDDAQDSNSGMFVIYENAPDNSFFMDTAGNIGFQTDNPSADIELVDSNGTSTIKLTDIDDNTSASIRYNLGGLALEGNTSQNILGMDATAPGNSLFIDDGGAVGLGTSTPDGQLHVVDSDALPLVLEGFGTRFDFNLGPIGLWFRDDNDDPVLKLNHSAGDNALVVDGAGIGVGTDEPAAELHVSRSTGAQLRVENTGAGDGTNDIMFRLTNASSDLIRFVMKNASSSWTFDNAGNLFRIALVGGSTTPEFTVDGNGDAHFRGDVYANGIKLTSSRALKTGFTPVDEATLLAKVAALDISQWRYKKEPTTAQHIGPMAEQFQAVFGLGDGKHLEMVDTTGISFAAIQALEAENDRLKAQLASMQAAIADLQARSN